MRITRPLAKAAVAALVVTSAIGIVGSSPATAAPVSPIRRAGAVVAGA